MARQANISEAAAWDLVLEALGPGDEIQVANLTPFEGQSVLERAAEMGMTVIRQKNENGEECLKVGRVTNPTLLGSARKSHGAAAAARSQQLPQPVKAAIDARMERLTVCQLRAGMLLKGVVRSVVHFGAFVDVGVGHDGLLHTSEYPLGPTAASVAVNSPVEVTFLSAECRQEKGGRGKAKWRIRLSMK